jgi:hypothetical protein
MSDTLPLGHPLNPILGDLWDQPGAKVIPTNTQGVHGRGVAKQAADKGLIDRRNATVQSSPYDGDKTFCVAVKGRAPETARIKGKAWSEQVVADNLELMRAQLGQLHVITGDVPAIYSPMLGCGFGEGRREEILPILIEAWERFAGRLRFVSPDSATFKRYASTFAPGIRQDSSIKHVTDLAPPTS